MKICKKCNQLKELKEFNKAENIGKKDGLSSWCKFCVREKSKLFYEKNKEKQKLKFQKQNKEKSLILYSLKEDKKCEKCGYNKCMEVLDFHHLDPNQKEFNISNFGRMKGFTKLDQVIEEIKKCVVLCSNCHREFHYLEKTQNILIEQFLNNKQ
ncbi:MAG TPA: hypothetical protein VFV86_06400 [Nitrososphaeraceae archaeon]|nr:hypothetical protein [Nitrososphaeraceae archaeon]